MENLEMKVGDRVEFSHEFLKNTAQHIGWAPQARGVIKDIDIGSGVVLCVIDWDDGSTSSANAKNLVMFHASPAPRRLESLPH